MADYNTRPLNKWTEQHVSHWLQSIPINQKYIDKLYEEEVSGPVLKEIDEEFLKNVGMKQGPIKLLIKKRNELVSKEEEQNSSQRSEGGKKYPKPVHEMGASSQSCEVASQLEEVRSPRSREVASPAEEIKSPRSREVAPQPEEVKSPHSCEVASVPKKAKSPVNPDIVSPPQRLPKDKTQSTQSPQKSSKPDQTTPLPQSSQFVSFATFRPFDKEVGNFKYVKGHVLPPESGVEDLIKPCHEYKSLSTASKLDRTRLQAKFASEVIRFASACMNVRSNGTIHFGVMDSKEDKLCRHGHIMGIPVEDQDWYVDALDYIERCFNKTEHDAARACIRTPKFIEVVDKQYEDQRFVVEVDIVPYSGSVKLRVFQASLPKFIEKSNKVNMEKKIYYRRTGAKSEPVPEDDVVMFIQGLQELDSRREKAETIAPCETTAQENLTKKIDLLTGGKEYMDDTIWYILVTNKWEPTQLANLNFLMRLKIFCVFDFDADSEESGLCSRYKEHHARNIHSLTDYSNDSGMSLSELRKSLGLFDQTSWIFCNGRNNFRGGDKPCDENTWIKNKKKYMTEAISLICGKIFPSGTFVVVFLLMSPVEKPIVDTFHSFYSQMQGMEDIICIAENKEYYSKWASLAQLSCDMETLEQRSIVGLQLSHIDATVQSMFPIGNSYRNLPVSSKGVCVLKRPDEEKMHSLEILCVNECCDKNLNRLSKKEVKNLEMTFYRGGKMSWKHLWFAEHKKCGDFIERSACNKVQNILHGILYENTVRLPVARIKIYHHPGSGGSTVARQVMWKNRNNLRCAIVRSSYLFSTVGQHAVKLREYEEDSPNQCLPVLLLVEDCEEDYLDDLRHELTEAMVTKKIVYSKPCFILMSCKRSNVPEDFFKTSVSDTVVITHKLSLEEKRDFSIKAKELEKDFPSSEFIITFVLMSHEFNEQYVKDFVQNVLRGIDHSSVITRLMRYVALLNCYVQNSYISASHCEAFLGFGVMTKQEHKAIQECNFKSHLFKSEQARLLFIELREQNTWISSIHFIHPLVAKEVLNQLSEIHPQSEIAKDLLEEKVLLQHRFGQDEFIKFIRDLFLLRYRKSRGDSVDTFFSPMIEHVCEVEQNTEKAIKLLKAAYQRFDKDPFFAQQLARLHCMYKKFEEARNWAETAKSQLPHNSFILHTEGQVYRMWFNELFDKKRHNLTPEYVIELIELSLKSMDCFRAAEQAAKSESDCMNDSAYFGEIDVGCRLLYLLSLQPVFSKNTGAENTELLKYLLTDHIPVEIEKLWFKFHSRLKGLYQTIYNALEWIADDVGYFQSEKVEDGVKLIKTEEHLHSPRKWLLRKTKEFAKFFSSEFLLSHTDIDVNSQLIRKMSIYKLGGGSTATILSILSDSKDERSSKKLEEIINLYPEDIACQGLDDAGLANYIMSQIALGSVCPGSPKLLSLQKLRELGKRFLSTRKVFPPSVYLLTFLLYWPDSKVDNKPDVNKDNVLANALKTARGLHEIRIKNVPVRKKRTNVLFFLGKGHGLQKIIHRSTIEKEIAGPLNEKRMKWDNDDLTKFNSVHRLLTNVHGWTENGRLYAEGHCKKNKIEILSLNPSSVPHGSENVTFYLGFTFIGFVAYNIQLQMDSKV
ncbi:sterile alpha motif domain-containing protein 9-like isoform X1 [Bufo bufo]|uniref:sterile alpha motif domain-containing protein 9-like isoform X1 n=2 Tax=Bufo bufo TaxID=8384 RepID=UPI001ABE9D11|nr:sterile alpha motif domain-containing protein 9-like isoform X1 [Bufo bufo]XP_040290767.1 sterile alpha motif domain-containing protein 9-like isoform X1 [Bufo bufo]XP_040290768.1 sterile alpha motif domain-containing protein 9-like isoform X1 [Bufo bufo]